MSVIESRLESHECSWCAPAVVNIEWFRRGRQIVGFAQHAKIRVLVKTGRERRERPIGLSVPHHKVLQN